MDTNPHFSNTIFPDFESSGSTSNSNPFHGQYVYAEKREVFTLAPDQKPKKRAGRKVFKETRHPTFRGVRERNNKWVCELREPNKKTRIWLGTYPTPEMAARAHDVAALALKGNSACLNFVDSAWTLPVPASNDAKDIRDAAALAAEAFRPRGGGGDRYLAAAYSDDCSGDVAMCGAYGDNVESMKSDEDSGFFDEEAVFDMPGLLVDMAEGLMLSPPPVMQDGFNYMDGDNFTLWDF